MTTLHEYFARAMDEFGRRVHAVKDEQWHDPTPCADWDVHALVNHLVNELLWVPPLMSGATVADVGDALDGDLLGADPYAAWDSAVAAASAAVNEPGAMERTVHLSFADVPGSEYAWQLAGDLLIHAWDLARGIGADEQLDPELVALVSERLAPEVETYANYGLFGPQTAVADGADAQAQLLAMSGRTP